MILIDKPEENPLNLPPDALTDSERLNRLFSGITGRWRLLAILTIDSGPSNLVIPEIKKLISRYGSSGLATRVVLISENNSDLVLRETRRWNGEDVVATCDSIHARRFLGAGSLPSVRLFTPDSQLRRAITGFDTEYGLDPIDEILSQEIDSSNSSADARLKNERHEAANKLIIESNGSDFSVLEDY